MLGNKYKEKILLNNVSFSSFQSSQSMMFDRKKVLSEIVVTLKWKRTSRKICNWNLYRKNNLFLLVLKWIKDFFLETKMYFNFYFSFRYLLI